MDGFFVFLGAAFLLSLVGVGVARDYALAHRVMDTPNERSSHVDPTPRGGGLAIILVFFAGSAVLFVWKGSAYALALADVAVVGLTAGAVALVGWLDDRRSLSPAVRIAAHFAAAVACVVWFGVPKIPLGHWEVHLEWVGVVPAAIAMVWCLNLFNFMDGTDGIAAVQALTMAVGALIVLKVASDGHALSPYLWLLAAVVAGFLAWNWAPAKVFMGDAASGFLGFLLAQFALLTSDVFQLVGVNVWCWLILFGVFFTDATVTLALRAIAGERVFEAHRQHMYQRLARALQQVEVATLSPALARANAHRAVSFAVAAVNLLWLTPLAGIALAPLIVSVLFTARHTDPS